MKNYISLAAFAALFLAFEALGHGQTAGTAGANDLVIAQGGASTATIVVSAQAGKWEKQAAEDLQKYIERMSGAKPAEVAARIEPEYAKGVEGVSIAIEDGNYVSDSARDKEL